ncbi:MAG: hypothetical protein GX033_05300 [Firmicutes bacterium]|nr:hypothetical protein [Bacillota bacterium]
MLSTEAIMQMALDLVGMKEIPGDSAIYHSGQNIKKVLFGIDIGTAELVMAKQLGYDAVIAHHPPQTAAIPAWKVYLRHIDLLTQNGVPQAAAEAAVLPRAKSMAAAFQSANHDRYPSIARLLDIPFMNIHCPLDELGRRIMQETVDACLAANPDATLGDVVDALNALPEFSSAHTKIEIAIGDAQAPAKKVVVAHGALTNGGYNVANAYFEHGIPTVLYIHIPYADLQRLREEAKGQLIVSGHISGDLVGINPFVQKLRAAGLEVTAISGIR